MPQEKPTDGVTLPRWFIWVVGMAAPIAVGLVGLGTRQVNDLDATLTLTSHRLNDSIDLLRRDVNTLRTDVSVLAERLDNTRKLEQDIGHLRSTQVDLMKKIASNEAKILNRASGHERPGP